MIPLHSIMTKDPFQQWGLDFIAIIKPSSSLVKGLS